MVTALKMLLQQRHLQTVGAFTREYDRLAAQMAPHLVGQGPKKAQLYRWMAGAVTSLPYPHHRLILEAMFPGWSAAELFSEYSDAPKPQTTRAEGQGSSPMFSPGMADVTAVFPSRMEFIQEMPPRELFGGAARIDLAGLSLNLLCQQYSDTDIMRLLESGTSIRCLFLDPEGQHIRHREVEEGHADGVLINLTRLNIQVLTRILSKGGDQVAEALQIRVYDEPIRFNITIIDNDICIVQPYLPNSRGVESPTMVARNSPAPGIFDTFAQVFEAMWSDSKEIPYP